MADPDIGICDGCGTEEGDRQYFWLNGWNLGWWCLRCRGLDKLVEGFDS